jgi:hypothetical protein
MLTITSGESGTLVAPTFFAYNIHCPKTTGSGCPNAGWPSHPVGAIRTWDMVIPGVNWGTLEPASGTFNFSSLDTLIAIADARNADIVFTFGLVPKWAATNPTQDCTPHPAGSCTPPSDLASDGTGTDATVKSFVDALTAHLATADPNHRFRYFEIWNEPQFPNNFMGTNAQMARITKDVHDRIRASSRSDIQIASPAPSAGPQSIANYFDGYLSDPSNPYQYLDAIDYHTYQYFSNRPPLASDTAKVVNAVNAELVKLELNPSAKPQFATEGSWGVDSITNFTNQGTVSDTTPNHMGYAAQLQITHACLGLSRFYWYAWDNNGGQGQITGGVIENSGIANGEVYNWLVGARITSACITDHNGTTTLALSRPGGYSAQIIWNATASTPVVPAPQFTRFRDLAANVVTVDPGKFMASYNPVILESGPPPGVSISTSSLPGGRVGAAYSQSLGSAGGSGSMSWEVRSGNATLPGGLTLASNGTLSGSPTAAGTFNFVVGVLDGASGTAISKPFSLTVNP